MFLPSFRHLVEIEALKVQNQKDNEEIASERKRISDIEAKRKNIYSHLEELQKEVIDLKLDLHQKEIEESTKKLNRMKSQMDLVTNEKEAAALGHQIETINQEITQKEDDYFSKLERSEAIAHEMVDSQNFLKGSLITIAELETEVKAVIDKIEQQIIGRNKRIESLQTQCEPKLLTFYSQLEKKFHPKRPVAFLIDKKCSQCHIMVDSMFKASLEEGRSFETCPNCGRLLIPETAKIY